MTTEMRVSLAALAASSGSLANSQRARTSQWTTDERSPHDRAARHIRFDPTASCVAPSARPEPAVPIHVDETAQTGRFRRTFARGTGGIARVTPALGFIARAPARLAITRDLPVVVMPAVEERQRRR